VAGNTPSFGLAAVRGLGNIARRIADSPHLEPRMGALAAGVALTSSLIELYFTGHGTRALASGVALTSSLTDLNPIGHGTSPAIHGNGNTGNNPFRPNASVFTQTATRIQPRDDARSIELTSMTSRSVSQSNPQASARIAAHEARVRFSQTRFAMFGLSIQESQRPSRTREQILDYYLRLLYDDLQALTQTASQLEAAGLGAEIADLERTFVYNHKAAKDILGGLWDDKTSFGWVSSVFTWRGTFEVPQEYATLLGQIFTIEKEEDTGKYLAKF